jgi:hypothetical protein
VHHANAITFPDDKQFANTDGEHFARSVRDSISNFDRQSFTNTNGKSFAKSDRK